MSAWTGEVSLRLLGALSNQALCATPRDRAPGTAAQSRREGRCSKSGGPVPGIRTAPTREVSTAQRSQSMRHPSSGTVGCRTRSNLSGTLERQPNVKRAVQAHRRAHPMPDIGPVGEVRATNTRSRTLRRVELPIHPRQDHRYGELTSAESLTDTSLVGFSSGLRPSGREPVRFTTVLTNGRKPRVVAVCVHGLLVVGQPGVLGAGLGLVETDINGAEGSFGEVDQGRVDAQAIERTGTVKWERPRPLLLLTRNPGRPPADVVRLGFSGRPGGGRSPLQDRRSTRRCSGRAARHPQRWRRSLPS